MRWSAKTARLIVGLAAASSLTLGAFASPATADPRHDPRRSDPHHERTATVAHHDAPWHRQGCSLDRAKLTVQASKNQAVNDAVTRYGNTSGQWVGADSTYSVPLGHGQVAWLFSDTLYGRVRQNQLPENDSLFLNNTIVEQRRGRLTRTITGGTKSHPTALVPPKANGDWSWFGDGIMTGRHTMQIGVLGYHRFGEGYWDWKWATNSVATLDTRTWKVRSVKPLPSQANIQWASWYRRDGRDTLVYGVEDLGSAKYLHVARVKGHDLSRRADWRFFDGTGWVRDEKASARVLTGVANEYSVTPFHGGYLLITQDTTEPFSNKIVAYTSCSPTGPFTNRTEVYSMPEVGAYGSYGDANVFAYNAHEHPEFRRGGRLLVSYNVNSFDTHQIFHDVSIYRPRFIDVRIDVARP